MVDSCASSGQQRSSFRILGHDEHADGIAFRAVSLYDLDQKSVTLECRLQSGRIEDHHRSRPPQGAHQRHDQARHDWIHLGQTGGHLRDK